MQQTQPTAQGFDLCRQDGFGQQLVYVAAGFERDALAPLYGEALFKRLPDAVTRGALHLIDAPWGGRITGQSAPVGLAGLDFVARADELSRPLLLMHSDDDGYVPPDASRELAERRPDIVTFVPFKVARHTKLWNYDEPRWTNAITDWLERLGE